jgi:hypothetical protein
MIASVGLCTLAGVGAVALPRVLGIPVLAAIVVLSPFADAAKIPRAQWREAGEFLQKYMRRDDLAVVSASASRRLFDYYVPQRDVNLRGVDTPALPVSLPLDGRRVWLIIHDSWYPANVFVARGNLRIERRLLRRDVLVLELTDQPALPEPAATPALPSPSAATRPTTWSH